MPWLLLLLGCDGWLDDPVMPSPLGDLSGDEVVWYAPLSEAPAPLPRGLADGLPPTPEGLDPMAREALLGSLCRGRDPGRVDALAERLAAEEHAAGAPWTVLVLDGCTSAGPGLCDAIDARLRDPSGPPGYADLVLWHLAGACPDPKLWDWMPRSGGSIYGVVDYLAAQDDRFRPVTDVRVPDLVGPVVFEEGVHGVHALQALGAMDHPRAAHWLLQAADADPAAAVWLYRQSDPTARARFEAACAQWPEAWQCAEGLDPLADLRGTVSSASTDMSALIDRYPGHRSAIVDALADCVDQGVRGQNDEGGRCLRALAGAGEGARATQVIHDVGYVDPAWRSRKAAWEDLGGAEGIGAHLVSEGLLPEGWTPTDRRDPPVWVVDFFVESGRGHAGTGITNVDLLRRLLAEVPELADVVVAGRVWAPVIEARGPGSDELFAWVDGRRMRGLAYPGELDTRRVAGIANSLARERELDVRFVAVAPGDAVIFGLEKPLRRLVDAGYLDLVERVRPLYEELGTVDEFDEYEGIE